MKTLPGILLTALILSSIQPSFAGPLHVICIGDSITQGGKKDRKEYTYRWPLFCKLVDAGVDFDFIGSRSKGLEPDATWPQEYKGKKFDPDHEGYYGIKTVDALKKVTAASENWTAAPDIALIHLGTNDKKEGDPVKDVKEPLSEMIRLLRKKNPGMLILLGHLNFNDDPGAFRIMAVVTDLKNELYSPSSPIITVHHYQGWNENPDHPGGDTFDWAHPNPQGQQKMADKWFEAMKPWLKKKELLPK